MTTYTDTFDREDSTDIGTVLTETVGDWQIINNQLNLITAAVGGQALLSSPLATPNQRVSVSVEYSATAPTSGQTAGLRVGAILRHSGTTGYFVVLKKMSTEVITIITSKTIDGAPTEELDETIITPTWPALLVAEIDGSAITVQINGVEEVSINDSSITTGNGAGVSSLVQSTTRTAYINSFTAEDIFSNPVADAGEDQTVEPFVDVTLSGSGMAGDYEITDYDWTQLSGPTVTINGTGANRTFEAPAVLEGTALQFGLTVTDERPLTSAQDTITITVNSPTDFWANSPDWTPLKEVQL